jgi:gas vesicle protein
MFRPRFLVGLLVGGAAAYFFDPQHGSERRAQVASWWQQNRGPITDMTNQTVTAAEARVNKASARVRDKAAELQGKTEA